MFRLTQEIGFTTDQERCTVTATGPWRSGRPDHGGKPTGADGESQARHLPSRFLASVACAPKLDSSECTSSARLRRNSSSATAVLSLETSKPSRSAQRPNIASGWGGAIWVSTDLWTSMTGRHKVRKQREITGSWSAAQQISLARSIGFSLFIRQPLNFGPALNEGVVGKRFRRTLLALAQSV